MSAIKRLAEKLYGEDGLGATNFHFSPGTNREVSAEQVADEILNSIEAIENGDCEIIE